ncbi:MAG: hypothetical protein ACLP62_09390 [Acidimicrobiales bacterium]
MRSRVAAARQFLAYCRDNGVDAPNVTKTLDRLREAHPKLLGNVQDRYEAARLSAALRPERIHLGGNVLLGYERAVGGVTSSIHVEHDE